MREFQDFAKILQVDTRKIKEFKTHYFRVQSVFSGCPIPVLLIWDVSVNWNLQYSTVRSSVHESRNSGDNPEFEVRHNVPYMYVSKIVSHCFIDRCGRRNNPVAGVGWDGFYKNAQSKAMVS